MCLGVYEINTITRLWLVSLFWTLWSVYPTKAKHHVFKTENKSQVRYGDNLKNVIFKLIVQTDIMSIF